MSLYLLRHGEAESYAARDEERRLTERGLRDLARTAEQFRSFDPPLALCLVSPYLRARQSAEAFLGALGRQPPTRVAPWLRPEESPHEALRLLDELSGALRQANGADTVEPAAQDGPAQRDVTAAPPGNAARDSQHGGASDILLVAHNPLLSSLGGLLLEGGSEQGMVLGTAELLWIDIEYLALGTGALRQHLRPAHD